MKLESKHKRLSRCLARLVRCQFVFVGWRSWFFGLVKAEGCLAIPYRWFLHVGPIEIRRWTPNAVKHLTSNKKLQEQNE